MNNLLFSKLAIDNIRKNKSTYFPYMFSSIIMIALFYILHNVNQQIGQSGFYGERTMEAILNFGVNTTGVFSVIFIFYTNSFLIKRRKKELGLYSVLGMEKKHIGKVLINEFTYSGIISLIGGVITGLVFSRLMFAILIRILKLDTPLKFNISTKSLIITTIVFAVTFVLVIIFNLVKIHFLNPIDLIKGEKKGEKEPRGNIIITLIGLAFLGYGYYLALTIKNPIEAFTAFFIAVGCVSIATYLLFTSGSIRLIKMLRKNKSFYYNKNNFISVSNMLYRMKQNAVGLANIAILSTAVLITLSTTVSLYVGMEDVLRTRFPYDVITDYVYEEQDIEKIENTIIKHSKEKNVEINGISKYFSFSTADYLKENKIVAVDEVNMLYKDIYFINIISLEDYNRNYEKNLTLNKDEVLIKVDKDDFNYETINIYGKEFKIKSEIEAIDDTSSAGLNTVNIVVESMDSLNTIKEHKKESDKSGYNSKIRYEYNFNLSGDDEDKIEFVSTLRDKLNENIERVGTVESIYTSKQSFYSLYGSLFFIGVFLGSLFMVATVLIIYYKQISEGYDDKERFEILQKVGMSKEEVRKTIRSQILTVFFLPLITAIIHISVAFPIVTKLLAGMNLTNTKLFLIFTGLVILVFGIVYTLVYRWTAKVYYRIVN